MNYCEIKNCDIANGEGVRVTLFVSGCRRRCKGCFQPQTWDFNAGRVFSYETEQEIMDLLKPDFIEGLTLLGGEPFEPENVRGLTPFIKRVHRELRDKTLWAFTGYTYEELQKRPDAWDLLEMLDVLVDGPFREEQHSPALKFRGSANQRVIDMHATRRTGEVVTLPGGVHERGTPNAQ